MSVKSENTYQKGMEEKVRFKRALILKAVANDPNRKKLIIYPYYIIFFVTSYNPIFLFVTTHFINIHLSNSKLFS